ncbi:KAP family P-loop NTPase fold protein [Pararhodobacter sp.]|uniref:KAP family P-loop NTPase fold protein n=1 Tax=Pararhodobacter sp. TaxID=2127056 RepID=UPI002FDF823C
MQGRNESAKSFSTHDLIGREKASEALTSILTKFSRPLVICVDGEWGVGKTHFIQLWMNDHAEAAGIKAIYVNAFEVDYQRDAFFSLASAILSAAEQFGLSGEQVKARYVEAATKMAKLLLRSTINVGVRVATAGIAGISEGDAVVDAIREGVTSEVGAHLSEMLVAGAKRDQTISEFKNALSAMAASLSEHEKLVVVVDELDRCRPTFAIDMLEVLKHFFSVDGVSFVLCASFDALSSGIEAIYGSGISGRKYLSRFVNYSIPMSAFDDDASPGHIRRFVESRWGALGLSQSYDLGELIETTCEMALRTSASLRDVERVIESSAISFVLQEKKGDCYEALIVLFAFMKVKNYALAEKFSRKVLSIEEFEGWFGKLRADHPGDAGIKRPYGLILEYLRYGSGSIAHDDKLRRNRAGLEHNFRLVWSPWVRSQVWG